MAANKLLFNPTETECMPNVTEHSQQLMEVPITKTLKLGESLIKLVYATRNLVGILVIIRFFLIDDVNGLCNSSFMYNACRECQKF